MQVESCIENVIQTNFPLSLGLDWDIFRKSKSSECRALCSYQASCYRYLAFVARLLIPVEILIYFHYTWDLRVELVFDIVEMTLQEIERDNGTEISTRLVCLYMNVEIQFLIHYEEHTGAAFIQFVRVGNIISKDKLILGIVCDKWHFAFRQTPSEGIYAFGWRS